MRSLVLGAAPIGGYKLPVEFYNEMGVIFAAGAAGEKERARRLFWSFAPLLAASTRPAVRARLDQMMIVDYSFAHSREDAPRRQSLDPAAASRLSEISVPTLIAVGDREMRALAEEAEFMTRNISGARKVLIRDAGHIVNIERPDEFNRVVLEFLRQH